MLWVIKLGGSLAKTSALKNWLYSLTEFSKLNNIKIVIVPGGGPFADQVRDAQSHWKFDDGTAHQMALLAMEQYGLMMKGVCSQVELTKDLTSIEKFLEINNVCIWLPYQMVSNDKTIPENWDMTSDSLAAWLANLLRPNKFLLIKSFTSDKKILDANTAATLGWVDSLFPQIIKQTDFEIRLLYQNDFRSLQSLIMGEALGALITNEHA